MLRNRGEEPAKNRFTLDAVSTHRESVFMRCQGQKTRGVKRISISLPPDLQKELDRMIHEKGYTNRSLALADMIRDHLVEHKQHLPDAVIAGSITLVYDHHSHAVTDLLLDLQHKYRHLIICTMHVHLDKDNCLEILAVHGKAGEVKMLADRLISEKGVKHGKLTITSTGQDLPA